MSAVTLERDPFKEHEMKFPLGTLCITPGAKDALDSAGQRGIALVLRHSAGDWGDLCEEDRFCNDADLQNGGRLLSAYRLKDGKTTIWIITEWDRSSTTILLPEEY